MSDVIVSTTESTTDVTTTNDVTTVAITNTVVEISQATAGVQGPPGSNSDPTYVFVTNKTGATLAKGSIVYVSGANGVHTQVSLALATGDITSARTLGWLAENIANNATGLCCVEGYLDGINTQGVTEGAQLYLSPTTPGAFTQTKPSAPDHMVYVGFCSKASAGNGRVFVHVQNGAELEELHDVKIVSPQNNDLLRYVSGTALWENVASTAITVGSAIHAGTAVYATNAGTSVYATTSGTSVYATNAGTSVFATNAGTSVYASTAGTSVSISGSITRSQVSDFTSGTVASASTAQQAGTAVYATTSGTADYATTSGTSVTISGSITKSQVSDFTSGTVASAGTAQQAGTSVYATNAGTSVYATTSGTAEYATTSGTSVYATTSGTAVSISGSITRSQVSDYASGTVANISGTVTQSQVTNLTTSLASKAGTADNNTFTGTNTFSNFTTFQAAADAIPIRIFGANGQSADLFSVNDYLTNTQFEILSDGRAQSLKGIIATVSGTASIPLVVRGTAGQSANILQIETAISTAIRVNSVGNTTFTGNITSQNNATFTPNSSAIVPLTVRGASGQSANLQSWQLSDTTETTRVRSGGQIGIGSLITGTTFAVNTDTVGGASSVGVVIRGASGQSADLLQIQNSGSTAVALVTSAGALTLKPVANAGNQARGILLSNTSDTWQSGMYLKSDASGFPRLSLLAPTGSLTEAINIDQAAKVGLGFVDPPAQLSVASGLSTRVATIVRGAASQSANLQEWQTSSGSTAVRVAGDGQFVTTQQVTAQGGLDVTGGGNGLRSIAGAASVIPIVAKGATSQTADLQQWQTSTGSTAAKIDASGYMYSAFFDSVVTNSGLPAFRARLASGQTGDSLQIMNNSSQPLAGFTSTGRIVTGITGSGFTALTSASLGQVTVLPASTATVGVVVQGLSGQSANLQNWNIDGGTIRASVDASGNVRGNSVRTLSDYTSLLEAQAGGYVRLTRATATIANPGANLGNLYFVAGTNANTLKLVVRAGAAGAETTILDNIPT